MVIKLLRLLQGYVIFEATGGFAERFLNLCKINNINLWHVKNDGVKVVAFTSAAEFSKINNSAKKSGMDIKTLKKCGLPFFAKSHKWRFGAVCGIIIAILFVWTLSGFIWEVEIVSTDGVKIEGFTDKLHELGVKNGARKSEINILEVQEQLLDSFSQLSWVSLNIFGTKAQVEYTYAKPQAPIVDKYTLTNVVAIKNGKVTLVEGYSGVSLVKSGEYVTKGSLLISGVIKNADLSESFVHASGKVFAQTENQIAQDAELSSDRTTVKNSERQFLFRFFGLTIPLGKKNKDAFQSTTDMLLQGNNTTLPIGFIRRDFLSFNKQKVELNQEECRLQAFLECIIVKREQYNDAKLEDVKYFTDFKSDKTTVIVKIKCIENIAKEYPVAIN